MIILPSQILHTYKFGEQTVTELVSLADSLGYPYFEWNGRVYLTPDGPRSWQQCCQNDLGPYEEVTGFACPTYDVVHVGLGQG